MSMQFTHTQTHIHTLISMAILKDGEGHRPPTHLLEGGHLTSSLLALLPSFRPRKKRLEGHEMFFDHSQALVAIIAVYFTTENMCWEPQKTA